MKNNSQMITARQGNRIMILEIFSAAAMFLPQIALQKSYHSGIVVVVMASVMAGIYLWIVDHAARGVSIENVLKRYRFAAIIYYVRFLLNGAFFYLCILYLTKKYLLPDKSTFFIGLPLLLLAYLMNQGGLTKRGRVMEGIFWFVLLPLIFVLILSMANLSWDELAVRSWCGREMLNGSILVFALMHPIEFVWFYRGDMRDGPIRMRSFAGLMILFLGVFASTVGSLGKKLTMVDPEPVMSMAQGVAMPGGIMARLDLFLIAFWIVGVFCVFSGYLFYGNESIKHAFSKGRIVGLSLSYGGIYVISPWIMTTFATWIRRYFFVFIYGNLVIGLFFPLILFLMWRNRKMKKYRGYLLVLLIAFCIQGCSKQQDVEDHSFVLAMGFERLNEKKVLVRYSYADFDKAQSDSGTKIPSRSVTFLATSLKDANKKWKQYKSQQLNFGHLKVVLFANGKKDEKIIKELVNEPQIAKSVYVLKTDRNLSDIFKKEDELSISFGEYLSKKLEIKDSKNLTLGRIYR